MPICITCTEPTSHLYTVYDSAYNLRLEQCKKCLSFADLYVEHDSLTLILDLILLKRGVYRHLLYNRGSEPRIVSESKAPLAQNTAIPTNKNDVELAKEKVTSLSSFGRLLTSHRQGGYGYSVSAAGWCSWMHLFAGRN